MHFAVVVVVYDSRARHVVNHNANNATEIQILVGLLLLLSHECIIQQNAAAVDEGRKQVGWWLSESRADYAGSERKVDAGPLIAACLLAVVIVIYWFAKRVEEKQTKKKHEN